MKIELSIEQIELLHDALGFCISFGAFTDKKFERRAQKLDDRFYTLIKEEEEKQ